MSPIYIQNARLIDPAAGYDGPGAVLLAEGCIAEVTHAPTISGVAADVEVVDASGLVLAPGLVDLRVKTGEPGAEPKETLKSAARAAAAGGVTTMVVQPDTDPVIDDPSVVDFILRRARDIELVHVYPAGAATKGCHGEMMAEVGLMGEAGAVYICDADRPIVDSRVMRRILTYAGGLGLLVAHRPTDPYLARGAAAHESEFSARMGLPSAPAAAELIMLQRDIALAELTGARLLVDQLSAAASLEPLAAAKAKGIKVQASVSINHLTFNELDIGDYRTFCKLDPPLRTEDDRDALIDALAQGLIDIVVSSHTPAPAEDKRLPFDEAQTGSIGLETLLPALLTLHHEGRLSLTRLFEAASLAPARALGLPAGAIAPGAPADLVLFNPNTPRLIDAQTLISKSKNSAFDGRRLQGHVAVTLVDGRKVYDRR